MRAAVLIVVLEHPLDELHFSDARPALTPVAITGELRAYLHSNGLAHAEVTPVRPGIEDAFMALMGTPEAVG